MKVHSCAKLDVLVLRRSTVLLYGSVVPCAVLLPSCAAFNYLPDVHLDVWASSLHIDPKPNAKIRLYPTSGPIQKSGKFSKSKKSRNRTFSFLDAGLLKLIEIEKNTKLFFRYFFCLFIWSRNFWHQICVQGPYLMRIDNLYFVGKKFKNISPD